MIRQKVEWTPLTRESADNLLDHWWYLLACKKHGTALKAKYHLDSAPYFEIFSTTERDATFDYLYLYELDDSDDYEITHYMDMPLLPWELEEIVHGCEQTDKELPFVEVKYDS